MMVGAEMDSADPCQELMDHPWPTIQLMCKSSHPLRSHSWILRELNCRAVGMNATEGTTGKDDKDKERAKADKPTTSAGVQDKKRLRKPNGTDHSGARRSQVRNSC